MSPIWLRAAQVVGVIVTAAAIVVLSEWALPNGPSVEQRVRESLVFDEVGSRLGTRRDLPAGVVWPVMTENRTTGRVVLVSVAGYQGDLRVAVAVDNSGNAGRAFVLTHDESTHAARVLGFPRPATPADGVSGATITARALGRATMHAERAADMHAEESR
jgi:hypothetical protein